MLRSAALSLVAVAGAIALGGGAVLGVTAARGEEAPADPDVLVSVEVPADPTPAPLMTPPPTATPLPTPAPVTALAIEPPMVTIDPADIGQGETALVTVLQPGAEGGYVTLFGRRSPLVRDPRGEGLLWAVIGVGLHEQLGPASASVTTIAPDGMTLATVEAGVRVVVVDRPVDYLVASDEVVAVLTPEAAATESYLRTYEQYNVYDGRPRWDGVLVVPAEGRITTAFGEGRSINDGPVTGHHSGTDIGNDLGTPVVAAGPGRVSWAGFMPIRGNTVLIDHGAGVMTGYSHLDSIEASVGEEVEPGQLIGTMGSTGFSTGPHLHWELTIYGVNVDPMTWTQRSFVPAED